MGWLGGGGWVVEVLPSFDYLSLIELRLSEFSTAGFDLELACHSLDLI